MGTVQSAIAGLEGGAGVAVGRDAAAPWGGGGEEVRGGVCLRGDGHS